MTTYDRTRAVKIMAANGLTNALDAYFEADATGLPLPGACALLAKESGGRNVYGHDEGGALAGYPGTVDPSNFDVFWWLVNDQGHPSNGVGPTQLTFPGFFRDMLTTGLKPWLPADNMRYGFGLLQGYLAAANKAGERRPWVAAGTRYNGAVAYGEDLAAKVAQWRGLLEPAVV